MEELRKLLNILVLLYKNIWKPLNTREYLWGSSVTLHSTVLIYCANRSHLSSKNTNVSVAISGAHVIGRVSLHGNMVTHFSRFFWPNSVIGLVPTGSGAWLGSCANNCCLTLVSWQKHCLLSYKGLSYSRPLQEVMVSELLTLLLNLLHSSFHHLSTPTSKTHTRSPQPVRQQRHQPPLHRVRILQQ